MNFVDNFLVGSFKFVPEYKYSDEFLFEDVVNGVEEDAIIDVYKSNGYVVIRNFYNDDIIDIEDKEEFKKRLLNNPYYKKEVYEDYGMLEEFKKLDIKNKISEIERI